MSKNNKRSIKEEKNHKEPEKKVEASSLSGPSFVSELTAEGNQGQNRRSFFANLFMLTSLVVSYSTAFVFALRFLYPVKKDHKQRLFVGLKSMIPQGSAVPFQTPQGQTINIVRGVDRFIALSNVCPHLGCRVRWESQVNEFVCPCHDGHFDASGKPTSGPPADTGVSLSRYEIIEDGDIVYIDIPVIS